MTYRVDDVPALPLVVVPAVAGNVIDLDPFDSVTASCISPDGFYINGVGILAATIEDDAVSITFPSPSLFSDVGVYSLEIILHSTSGAQQTIDPYQFVVENPDGWHTLSSARAGWTTGAPRSDVALYNLLATAKLQFSTFAPALASVATTVPQNYRDGQLLQARNTWNAIMADPGSSDSSDQFAPVRPFPLDRWVKALARPPKGVPTFG